MALAEPVGFSYRRRIISEIKPNVAFVDATFIVSTLFNRANRRLIGQSVILCRRR